MQITTLLVILIIFAILASLIKSKTLKGKIGEIIVAKSLEELGPELQNFKQFNICYKK